MTTLKLLDQVRGAIRVRHYSRRTGYGRVHRNRRYNYSLANVTHLEMGRVITAFLSDLADSKNVAASTQNQALSAGLFLCQAELFMETGWLEYVLWAKWPVTAHRPIVRFQRFFRFSRPTQSRANCHATRPLREPRVSAQRRASIRTVSRSLSGARRRFSQ